MKQDEIIKKVREFATSTSNGMRGLCQMVARMVESRGMDATFLEIQTGLPTLSRETLDEMLKFGQFPELATDDDMLRMSLKACSDEKILPSHQ